MYIVDTWAGNLRIDFYTAVLLNFNIKKIGFNFICLLHFTECPCNMCKYQTYISYCMSRKFSPVQYSDLGPERNMTETWLHGYISLNMQI